MTWRDVFDTKLAGTHIKDAVRMAHLAYYHFVAHNGRIYFIRDNEGLVDYHDTGLTVKKELEAT